MNDLDIRRRFLLCASGGRSESLYSEGEQYTNMTGGWDATLSKSNNAGSATFKNTYMYLTNRPTVSLSNPCRAAVVTQEAISTHGRRTLNLEFAADYVENASTIYIALYKSSTASDTGYVAAKGAKAATAIQVGQAAQDERQTVCLDISGLQGDYHVGVMYQREGGCPNNFYINATIYNVWME